MVTREEERLAAEAAVRLGDRERVRRALDKFVQIEEFVGEDGRARQRLWLRNAENRGGFSLAEGVSVTAAAAYLEVILINFLDEALS